MPEPKEPESLATNPPPAVPPAAETVVNGEQTEEVNTLKKKLEEKDSTIKNREQRINQLEDENRRLKDIPKTPAPAGPKQPKPGWGFFREEA